MMQRISREQCIRLAPSALILLFIIGYIATGYLTLDEASRAVPMLASFTTLFLLSLDLLKEFRTPVTRPASGDGAGQQDSGPDVSLAHELKAIGCVGGAVAGVYVIGFLAAIPLYLVVPIAYLGRQPLRLAAIIALLWSLLIYLVFEVALSYQLYPGVIFS